MSQPEAKINEYGDVVCPNCKANILTPPKMQLKAGNGKCSRCSYVYEVSQEVADLGNKLANREVKRN